MNKHIEYLKQYIGAAFPPPNHGGAVIREADAALAALEQQINSLTDQLHTACAELREKGEECVRLKELSKSRDPRKRKA